MWSTEAAALLDNVFLLLVLKIFSFVEVAICHKVFHVGREKQLLIFKFLIKTREI